MFPKRNITTRKKSNATITLFFVFKNKQKSIRFTKLNTYGKKVPMNQKKMTDKTSPKILHVASIFKTKQTKQNEINRKRTHTGQGRVVKRTYQQSSFFRVLVRHQMLKKNDHPMVLKPVKLIVHSLFDNFDYHYNSFFLNLLVV